ncbi:MAG TPA: beta-ketoacyl-ACP synthase III [Gemmatales bacterium]|nr:beta-ketoacyl-ACP synthase III [Gemmatales bacterium]HMP61303.1 beta-ketoacyl-ACP synthase III [Gemmatales bacterium]
MSKRPPCQKLMGVRVLATGAYVPDAVVTNEHLGRMFRCDPEWIVRRTGIYERRHALPHQATTDLCYEAARQCLERAPLSKEDIDLILVGTYTPDNSFPSASCVLQDRLGLCCGAMDVNVGCAGFLYCLVTAGAYLRAGVCKNILVIGGDINSRIANPEDPKTYPLFGDGAGAVILTRCDEDYGILAYQLGADGSGQDLLIRPGCGSRLPPDNEVLGRGYQYLHMDGRSVFRWAVTILSDSIHDVLDAAGLQIGDIDYFITHQANIRIIFAATDVLGIPREKVQANVRWFGNTSAGSVPIALNEAAEQGLIQRGRHYVLSGFGAGLAWSTLVLRW